MGAGHAPSGKRRIMGAVLKPAVAGHSHAVAGGC